VIGSALETITRPDFWQVTPPTVVVSFQGYTPSALYVWDTEAVEPWEVPSPKSQSMVTDPEHVPGLAVLLKLTTRGGRPAIAEAVAVQVREHCCTVIFPVLVQVFPLAVTVSFQVKVPAVLKVWDAVWSAEWGLPSPKSQSKEVPPLQLLVVALAWNLTARGVPPLAGVTDATHERVQTDTTTIPLFSQVNPSMLAVIFQV